jgi:bifunctional non-homologous end joining protein LigD
LSLSSYTKKRVLKKSGEPLVKSGAHFGKPIFVVHRHLAHQLHFDFRLEVDKILKSWAIPKGPSMNPKDKRLAIRVEDHPLAYKDFSGVIPDGYGAGIVEIWDHGYYEIDDTGAEDTMQAMKRSLAIGHVSFVLKGRKLKGSFALIRTGGKKREAWLLIKKEDKYAIEKKYDANDFTPASSRINLKVSKK